MTAREWPPPVRTEPAFQQPRDGAGRFVNLDGSGPRPLADVLRWAVLDRLAGRRRRSPKRAAVPWVRPDAAALRTPPGPGEGARLTWLGHASWLVQLGGCSLLVDPVLGPSIARVVPRNVPAPLGVAELPPIDAALVTHAHYDHLDLPSLRAVGAPVVAGLGTAHLLGALRRPSGAFAPASLPVELGWWSSVRLGAVEITFVPSQHWSRRHLVDANRALWGGFVLRAPGVCLYHAGDTARSEGFAEIGRRFALDAALLPIGAYDPAWFMGSQHLDPEEALAAFGALRARELFPMHWGTFKLTDEPLDEPPRRLEAERARLGIEPARVRLLPVGGVAQVP